MLPQTNLQLYRSLIEREAPEGDLALAREAYDLARQLFSSHYRPSHKPFLAHLIGVAGALAGWGEPIETVVAGMLHSAYLYGDFGDGQRGVTEARRMITHGRVGKQAEELICGYAQSTWETSLEQVAIDVAAGKIDRTIVVIKLADLCDEFCDAGPQFATGKLLEFGLPDNQDSRTRLLDLAATLVGAAAKAQFIRLLAECDACAPPALLQSSDRSFQRVGRVDDECGPSMAGRFHRLVRRVGRKRAG